MTDLLLEARGLTVGHGGAPVVADADLHVGPGELVALLGANGAGKTTTLLALSGLHPLTAGSVTVLGTALGTGRRSRTRTVRALVAAGLGHVTEDRGLFADLTVRQNLRLGAPARPPAGAVDEVLDLFPPLRPIVDRRAGLLSGGEQQMLAIARALVRRPRLLLVDELSLGLAPLVVADILPRLREVATTTGLGLLVVEQHVGLVLDVADRCYLVGGGAVTAAAADDLTADALRARYLGR